MTYLKQAWEGLNDWWRYPMVMFGVIVAYFVGQFPLTFAILRAQQENPDLGTSELDKFMENPDFSIYGIGNNTGLLLLLLSFIFAFPVLYYLFMIMHKRAFTSLINATKKVRWGRVLFGLIFWFLLACFSEFIMYLRTPETYTFQFELKPFLVLLLICITLLPIQTSLEEFVFRGYLMQGFASLLKNAWAPILITAILFGAIHSSNPEVVKYGMWQMQLYYLTAGLFLGIITVMDDGIELALGVHAATNMFGALMLSYEGAALQTDSLFRTSEINPILLTGSFFLLGLIFIIICSKKYKWASFNRLFQPFSHSPIDKV